MLEKSNSSPACALRQRNNKSVIFRDEKDSRSSLIIHRDLLPAPELCRIILKHSEEIKSLDRLDLITNPVIILLQLYKSSGRIDKYHRDYDIDSDDEMLNDLMCVLHQNTTT